MEIAPIIIVLLAASFCMDTSRGQTIIDSSAAIENTMTPSDENTAATASGSAATTPIVTNTASVALSSTANTNNNNTAWAPIQHGGSQTTFFLLAITIMVAMLFTNALKC